MKKRFLTLCESGCGVPASVVAGKKKPAQKRRPKNWIHVNIGESDAKRIRALAECMQIEYRGFLYNAIKRAVREAEQLLNIGSWEVTKIPRKRRLEMGRRHHELAVALRYCSGHGNLGQPN
jgi:hypothetical protein